MRICFFGDSLTNGFGDEEFRGWPGRICRPMMARGHEITCYNCGVRGNTSLDIRTRWESECDARVADPEDLRLVFSFGVNDTKVEGGRRRLALSESLEHAQAILAAALRRAPVLFVGPPPVADPFHTDRVREFSLALGEGCRSLAVPYLDLFPVLEGRRQWTAGLANDGYHPPAAGYQMIADAVASWDAWLAWFGL